MPGAVKIRGQLSCTTEIKPLLSGRVLLGQSDEACIPWPAAHSGLSHSASCPALAIDDCDFGVLVLMHTKSPLKAKPEFQT